MRRSLATAESAPTVREYFQILVDTLLGRFVPAYTKRPKRRVIAAAKSFFTDVGVVNRLARRGRLTPGGELYGKALENWVCHELSAYASYRQRDFELRYWRLASGLEVDFVTDGLELAVEAKATRQVQSDDLRGLRELVVDQPSVGRRVVVSLDAKPRRTQDGIEILPARAFAHRLWAGDLV
jgi:uncharacterized protein